jgi:ABC-type phosphate transport system substrate-binding protein
MLGAGVAPLGCRAYQPPVRSNSATDSRYFDSSKVGNINMDMSLRKRLVSGPLALLVGLGVLGCTIANLVLADASSAAVPPSGNNCVESDGKISGRGSTFQKVLVTDLAGLYRDDFCGKTGTETTEKGAAGNTMLAYNYPAAENAGATGSGAGLKAASCRTDAFAGTDLPYNTTQLAELDGTPGATGGCAITFEPPFQPKPGPWPDTETEKADTKANIMSFPIGGSSVTIPVHLLAGSCNGTAPTSLNFTPKEVSRILGGDAKEWSDAELVATNPSLKECKTKITRVVREDNSGTTNITKFYLIKVDNERTGAVCAPGKTWEFYNSTSPNTQWPGKQEPGKEGECSEITTAASSGNPELLKKLISIEASVGYADLGDATTFQTENPKDGVIFAHIQNATGTEFVAPNTGKGANCDYRTLSLPGLNAESAVGLNPEDNWASNNKEGNRGNATDLGSKYPICGLTWDLVYTGLDNGAVANPIRRLTADQRRTEYSFFTFVFSSAAQESLNTIEYAPLPVSWVGTIREGFQANF